MKPIPRLFYQRDTVDVARDLLGKTLVRKIGRNLMGGLICETEAYRHKKDPASHAFRGQTERNRPMFEEVGKAYVYFTYGMHYCVNAVARDRAEEAGAVLIRSLVPRSGLEFMMRRRRTSVLSNLTSGPAKITQALEITKKQCGENLTKISGLYIAEGIPIPEHMIEARPRIGISIATENLWNFRIKKEFLKGGGD